MIPCPIRRAFSKTKTFFETSSASGVDFATGLVIEKMPDKTTYKVGEDFDPTGMKIVANYNNQPAQDVTSEIIYVNNSNKNFDIYTQSVTVKYRYGNGMWKSVSIPIKMEHYYIEEAQIINLIPPVAGKNPDYDINDFTRFCDIATRQRDCWGYGWDNNGFAWYDEDGKMMGPSAVFEEGKEYTDCPVPFVIEDGVAKLMDRSAYAGSVATADRLVRTMINIAEVPLTDAVKMLTATPARIMGLQDKKGSLKEGLDADVILFDENIAIDKTIVAGKVIYSAR